MWGAEHLHGDEGSCLVASHTYSCDGCYAEYPEWMLGEKEGLQRIGNDKFYNRYCPDCRENMTCTRCSEYCESVDRQQGKSVC